MLRATKRLGEAEPLYRRALAIDEKSFGPDHPNVAIRLNNLAQLLRATNRLAEAEPLMRRTVAIVVEFTRRTGYRHPNLDDASASYARAVCAELMRLLSDRFAPATPGKGDRPKGGGGRRRPRRNKRVAG